MNAILTNKPRFVPQEAEAVAHDILKEVYGLMALIFQLTWH